MCVHASIMCIKVHADFGIFKWLLNTAEFADDEESESCLGGSILYSKEFSNFWSNMCMHASTLHINIHVYIWQIFLNSAEFGSDEENGSCSGGFNVCSQRTFKCCRG